MKRKTRSSEIRKAAVDILKKEPDGLRYAELVDALQDVFPSYPVNTIHGSMWDLDKTSNQIIKPQRGLFLHETFQNGSSSRGGPKPKASNLGEVAFYEPLAQWLKGEDECTDAIALGGNEFKDKWGTPDVFGVRKPQRTDVIKEYEVLAAEVKTDPNGVVTAFGQACSYRLFAHKAYIAVPQNSPDAARLKTLCRLYGIGLIFFNPTKPESPSFSLAIYSTKFDPDLFYVNKYLKQLDTRLGL